MKKANLIVLIAFVTALSFTHSLHAQKVITGFEAPESVLKYRDKLFVSNIGGTAPNPMALDSNGFIAEVSLEGNIIQHTFQKAVLNAPKGLAVAKNVLYVADINRVVGFDVNTGEEVFELPFTGVGMLNDVCNIDDSKLAVTDSNDGKVYLVDIAAKTYVFAGSVAGANGVTYNKATQQLYVCGMGEQMNGQGKLYAKSITGKDTVFTELPNSPTGIFDGLETTDNDHLLVTDWISVTAGNTKGRIVWYNLKDHSSKVFSVAAGPADFHYDKATRTVFIPQMLQNSVLVEKLADLKAE